MSGSAYPVPRGAYRVVTAEDGVRVLLPGGDATTALADSYADAPRAVAAIKRAIAEGLPELEIVDETRAT